MKQKTSLYAMHGLIPPEKLVLATDLYQITMARGYHEKNKQDQEATFDLFVRKLPKNRNYLVVAGIEQAINYLTHAFEFDQETISFLKTKPQFKNAKPEFWEYLENLEFTGEVWAVPEGEIVFQKEPIIRVTAPIIEAQLAETYLLSQINHQAKIASKAARIYTVARDKPFVEFGTRRTDPGAAVRAARAAYVGGAIGTSNVLAEYLFGIPSMGTHAHSWVMSFASEEEAFRAYFEVYGEETIALIDTYDTIEGAKKAASLPGRIKGVRIDSGDLAVVSREVREILDRAGKEDGIIFASSDLNEYRIRDLLERGARIDAFGVGTELSLSSDSPTLGGVYKLVELDGEPKIKKSACKVTLPGKKQVYRYHGGDGLIERDVIALEHEDVDGTPLLERFVKKGRLVRDLETAHEARERTIERLGELPESLRDITTREEYPVLVTQEMYDMVKRLGGDTSEIPVRC